MREVFGTMKYPVVMKFSLVQRMTLEEYKAEILRRKQFARRERYRFFSTYARN
jgi:hypothetical protein